MPDLRLSNVADHGSGIVPSPHDLEGETTIPGRSGKPEGCALHELALVVLREYQSPVEAFGRLAVRLDVRRVKGRETSRCRDAFRRCSRMEPSKGEKKWKEVARSHATCSSRRAGSVRHASVPGCLSRYCMEAPIIPAIVPTNARAESSTLRRCGGCTPDAVVFHTQMHVLSLLPEANAHLSEAIGIGIFEGVGDPLRDNDAQVDSIAGRDLHRREFRLQRDRGARCRHRCFQLSKHRCQVGFRRDVTDVAGREKVLVHLRDGENPRVCFLEGCLRRRLVKGTNLQFDERRDKAEAIGDAVVHLRQKKLARSLARASSSVRVAIRVSSVAFMRSTASRAAAASAP